MTFRTISELRIFMTLLHVMHENQTLQKLKIKNGKVFFKSNMSTNVIFMKYYYFKLKFGIFFPTLLHILYENTPVVQPKTPEKYIFFFFDFEKLW